jgi:lipopolysaccharide export system protein LptA
MSIPQDPQNVPDQVLRPDDAAPTAPGAGAESPARPRGRDLIPPPPLTFGSIPDDIEIVAEPARRGPGARRVGLLLAAALALIGGGVALLLWQRGGAPKPSPQRTPVAAVPIRQPDVPKPPTEGDPGIAGVTASQSARMQFMDRHDPGRVAGELRYSQLEPLERGQQLITEPRAWIYLRDGRTVHVQAAKARLSTNTAGDKPQEPESGTFEGAVVIRLYSAGPNGQPRPVDIDADRPTLMFTTDAFAFNTVLSEVTSASTWQASAAAWEYSARGLRLVYDEVSQRVELFETDGDNTAVYFRGADTTDATTAAASTPATPANPADPAATPTETAAAPTPTQPAAPEEIIYRAELSGPVALVGEAQRLEAPSATAWVRLIDGALRPGAIAPVKFVDAANPAASGAPRAAPGAPATDAPPPADPAPAPAKVADASPASQRGSEAPTGTLTWPGPITVRPVKTADQLARGDDVRVRLEGDAPDAVTMRDDKSGLRGHAQSLEYGATTRELVLAGPGPAGVAFTTKDGQRFAAQALRADITRGVVTSPGPGMLGSGDGPDAKTFRRIAWDTSAAFTFEMRDGAMTSALRRAELVGSGAGSRGVVASDNRSSLSADAITADFVRTDASPNVLSRVVATGSALADGRDAGSLGTDELLVEFIPAADGREAEPTRVVARGTVLAQREGTTLRAEYLESGLARNDKNDIGATVVNANGSVRFDRTDGVGATAAALTADARAQTVTLTGALGADPASVYKDKSVITGEKIDLDGAARTLLVTGPGNFSHEQARRKGPRGDSPGDEGLGDPDMLRAEASWTVGMRFNDVTGSLECEGDVVAMTDPSGMRVDLVRGHRVRLDLTPGGPQGKGSIETIGAAPARSSEPERRLLRAEVFGHSFDQQGGAPAVVESRQFTPGADPSGDGARTLERLLYIEGDHIIADAQVDTLNVPGPGKARIIDMRSPEGEAKPVLASQPADLAAVGRTVGASQFVWDGSLLFERRTGVLDLQRFVRVVHQPLNDPTVVKLEAERLTATLRSRRGADGQAPPAAGLTGKGSAELVKVNANDAVYLESSIPDKPGTRRLLICDRLNYNADARTAEAFAADNNRLQLFDETKGTSVAAERLFWDIATDRSEIIKPTPITAPR